jgi:hypothetical protein
MHPRFGAPPSTLSLADDIQQDQTPEPRWPRRFQLSERAVTLNWTGRTNPKLDCLPLNWTGLLPKWMAGVRQTVFGPIAGLAVQPRAYKLSDPTNDSRITWEF